MKETFIKTSYDNYLQTCQQRIPTNNVSVTFQTSIIVIISFLRKWSMVIFAQ